MSKNPLQSGKQSFIEDTVFTKEGLNGTLGIIRADSNDAEGLYHEVIIQRGDQEYDRKKISGDLDKAKEYLMSQWDKYESVSSHKRVIKNTGGSMGKVKSLKAVIEGLNKSDLEAVETEVRSSFEPDEIKKFKDFEAFFGAVDVQNGYEPEWKPKKWKPFYKAVYDKLMQEMK